VIKFRDRDHVIAKLVNAGGEGRGYEPWAWREFLEALDKAGYAIVQKPVLTDRGVRP
jgi:hypothetical protein